MTRELADYFDAYRPAPHRAGFASSVGLGAPSIGIPGIYDSEMWTMDVRWAPPRVVDDSGALPPRMNFAAIRPSPTGKAMWQSYVTCVRVAEVGGGWISQPWSVTGAALCTNVFGQRQSPKCPWGVWRLPACTAETLSLAWQGMRYLWAQQKMRELLAQEVTRDNAAQWVWNAYQLISLLHWSTNIRFNNPQQRMFDYRRELINAGCLFDFAAGYTVSTPRNYLGLRDWNTLDAEVKEARGPGIEPPLVPLSRGDFSPWFEFGGAPPVGGRRGVFDNAISLPPAVAATIIQQKTLVGTRLGWSRVMALRGPDWEAPMPAFVTWMRETWGQSTIEVEFPPVTAGRASTRMQIQAAQSIVDTVRRAMTHYVAVPYLKWQTTILNVYATEMQPFIAMLPGDQQLSFISSVRDFTGHAQAAQAASWNQSEEAAYTLAAMQLIASLVNSGAGIVLTVIFTLLNYLIRFLGDSGLMASGFSVCPAFPFIRVPDPPCNALGPPVDAVGLPIDPPPGPIMLTPAQRATLLSRERAGTLSPSQQALIARPLVIVQPPTPPAASSKGGGVALVGAAALLALLFSRR